MIFGRVGGRLHQKLNEVTSIYGVGSSKPLSQTDGIGLERSESLSRDPMLLLKINRLPCSPLLSFCLSAEMLIVSSSLREKGEACSLSGPRRLLCPWLPTGVRVGRPGDCSCTLASGHQGGRLTVPPGQIRSGGPWRNCGNTTCETRSDEAGALEQEQVQVQLKL